jgi:hypothetical protein
MDMDESRLRAAKVLKSREIMFAVGVHFFHPFISRSVVDIWLILLFLLLQRSGFWQCTWCKVCIKCTMGNDEDLFVLCDRFVLGFCFSLSVLYPH